MDNLKTLREVYPYDPATRTLTILARVSRFNDFFNPLDPSPAPARDLAPELVDYLNQCSDEIPTQYPVELALEIRDESRDARRENECVTGLRTYYQHERFVQQAHMRRKRGLALRYLLVSLTCLAANLLSEPLSGIFLVNLLREAVQIGGWLFMWEAVSINFIAMDDDLQAVKKFNRLIAARVNFRYP